MTSVNFMNVHLEEPQGIDDDVLDLNATSTSLFNQIPDLSDYFASRGDTGEKKNERKRSHTTDPRVNSITNTCSMTQRVCTVQYTYKLSVLKPGLEKEMQSVITEKIVFSESV